jgi:hypothetical protein
MLGRALSATGFTHVRESGDTSSHKNANRYLDAEFKAETRLTVMHRPYALTRGLYEALHEAHPEAFHDTRSSHLRSVNMVGFHNCFLPYWAYYQGAAELKPPSILTKDMFVWSNNLSHNEAVIRRVRRSRRMGFCLQENSDILLNDDAVDQFHEAMNSLYPEPSPFERTPAGDGVKCDGPNDPG